MKTETETEIVPLHEANVDRSGPITLTKGLIYELPDNRRIEVWKIKDGDGLSIRIFRPTNDGKTANLIFGLSKEAAICLGDALIKQLTTPKQ